jgi:hypothetical protein
LATQAVPALTLESMTDAWTEVIKEL